jgi:hypothetical protein
MPSRSPSKESRRRGLRDNDGDGTQQPLLGAHSSAAVPPEPAYLTSDDNNNDGDNNHNDSPLCALHHDYRRRLRKFLSSRTQHFCVLTLVALDLFSIFADIFINLYMCEEGESSAVLDGIRSGLGAAGLTFR